MDLICTKGGAIKCDSSIRQPFYNGETDVIKSDRCVSVACGRLCEGRALLIYIVFGLGENYDPMWAPCIKTPDIMDKDGECKVPQGLPSYLKHNFSLLYI